MDAAPPPSPARRRGPRRWAVLAAVVASLLALAALLREPIGRWVFPDAAVAGLLSGAERALAEGDATTAAARFEAARARHPDHPRIAEGLAETRALALAQAEAALAAGALDTARQRIGLAEALGAPGERVAALRRGLEERAQPALDVLLDRALRREPADAEGALADYRAVLERDPGNALALAGRTRLLAATLAEAETALARGDRATANALVERVKAIDPAHLALPGFAERLGALPLSRPVSPPPAAVSTEAVRWFGLAEEALGRGALDDARRALDRARDEGMDPVRLDALEARWRQARGAVAAPADG